MPIYGQVGLNTFIQGGAPIIQALPLHPIVITAPRPQQTLDLAISLRVIVSKEGCFIITNLSSFSAHATHDSEQDPAELYDYA